MYTTDKETGLADLGRHGLCGGAVQSSGELCYDPGRGCSHVTVSTPHLLRTDTSFLYTTLRLMRFTR